MTGDTKHSYRAEDDHASWDAEQTTGFLAVAARSVHGPIWLVAVATGLRRGELLGLRWQDVDEARGVLQVRQTIRMIGGIPPIMPHMSPSGVSAVPVAAGVLAALGEHR